MDAMQKVDPDARFVAFLRDFDWKYKDAERAGTESAYEDLILDVLRGLPSVQDFSLHFYYDDPGNTKRIKTIERRLRQFRRAVAVARKARGGDTPSVWITEHARGVDLPRGRSMDRAHLTGNLSGAISTADFLIGISQMPEIKGAFLHGLNAGPWQVFDASIRYNDLRPRPVYWAMRILRMVEFAHTLETRTEQETNAAAYLGGYDLRAAGFSNKARSALGLWAANRGTRPVAAEVVFSDLAGKTVLIEHEYIGLPEGADPEDPRLDPLLELDPERTCGRFTADGAIVLQLPAASVSGIRITATTDTSCQPQ